MPANWMPTWPTLEPLPLTKGERISGMGPSIFAQVWHITKQLVPNPNFILKWCAVGAFGLAAGTSFSYATVIYDLERDNGKARKWLADAVEETKRKETAARKETERKQVEATVQRAQEDQYQRVEEHARGNWETWKSQFTSDADGIACAYGHVFTPEKQSFTVTCQLGPKGHLPTTKVVCDAGSCVVNPPTEAKK